MEKVAVNSNQEDFAKFGALKQNLELFQSEFSTKLKRSKISVASTNHALEKLKEKFDVLESKLHEQKENGSHENVVGESNKINGITSFVKVKVLRQLNF